MQSKQILITGASRGIGFETALTLVDMGHYVIATARSEDALNRLRKAGNGRIDIVAADLSLPSGIEKIDRHLGQKKITLDGLIHNAGILINRPFSELEDSDWDKMVQVNLMGPVKLTRKLLKRLCSGAHIVHIGSMGGYQQSRKFPGLSGYSVTKGALALLTECLAEELKTEEIRVNCLCLGVVQTEMLEKAFPGMNAPVTAADMGRYIARFVIDSHQFYNGRILPVALSDPD